VIGLVRVRMAPSPTGDPHVGWARTALFNWLFARHEGGVFVLRIEDTDAARSHEGAVQAFDEAFRWMGFTYDEGPTTGGPFGPYIQSERKALHEAALADLLAEGAAYPCFCTAEELDAKRRAQRDAGEAPHYDGTCRRLAKEVATRRIEAGDPHVYRLKTPNEGQIIVHDVVRGEVAFDARTIDDFVLVKTGGTATYNFAAVVDDAAMQITHVIRGEEHLSNTPKQLLLYRALGITPPIFVHIPMVLAPDHTKLSKRHGATALSEYRQLGYLPEALVNYLMLLGWHPGGDEEIFTLTDAASRFRLEDIQKNAAIFDLSKLTWLNGHYLRSLSTDDLVARSLPFLEQADLVHPPLSDSETAYIRKVVLAVRERVSTLADVAEAATYFFKDVSSYDPKGVAKHFNREGAGGLLHLLAERLEGASFEKEALEVLYTSLAEERGVKRGELIHPTRLAVTGRTMGPGLFDILEILGPERVISRLVRAADAACP